MHASTTVLLSAYTYAFKEYICKPQEWFGPALNCKETVEALAPVAINGFIETDYSRFDGTISEFLQMRVVKPSYMRYFGNNGDTENLSKLFDSIFARKATTQSGFRYDPGWGTRSGSPITTEANTIINAFVCYAALRSLNQAVDTAWRNLGLYYGDDGIHRNIPNLENALVVVAKELGLTIEIQARTKHSMMTYLGRVFIDPLTSSDSFQDPRRFLPKLHLSANTQVSLEQAMYNKAIGYLVTDPLTPILSDWAQRQIELSGLTTPLRLTMDEYFKTTNAWPQENKLVILNAFSSIMKMSISDIEVAAQNIKSAISNQHYPIVYDNKRDVKVDAVFGGQIHRVEARPVSMHGTYTECIEEIAREERLLTTQQQIEERIKKSLSAPTDPGKTKPPKRSTHNVKPSQRKPAPSNAKASKAPHRPRKK